MKTTYVISILVLTLCTMVSAQSQENARLPYSTLFRMISLDLKEAEGVTRQEIRLTIKSKLPGVKQTDVRLYIDARSGRIPVPLNPDGTFSLPISKDLLKEDPDIEANQPRGTMVLTGTIALTGTLEGGETGDRQRYNCLFSVAEAARARLAKTDFGNFPISNAFSRMVHVVQLIPGKDTSTASVVIESTKGHQTVSRDKDGTFRIRRDTQLAEENPWVLMPVNHHWNIMSELQEQAEPSVGGDVKPVPLP